MQLLQLPSAAHVAQPAGHCTHWPADEPSVAAATYVPLGHAGTQVEPPSRYWSAEHAVHAVVDALVHLAHSGEHALHTPLAVSANQPAPQSVTHVPLALKRLPDGQAVQSLALGPLQLAHTSLHMRQRSALASAYHPLEQELTHVLVTVSSTSALSHTVQLAADRAHCAQLAEHGVHVELTSSAYVPDGHAETQTELIRNGRADAVGHPVHAAAPAE